MPSIVNLRYKSGEMVTLAQQAYVSNLHQIKETTQKLSQELRSLQVAKALSFSDNQVLGQILEEV